MTKTFTQTILKNLSKAGATAQNESAIDEQKFYNNIKPSLNKLFREPSEETIAKILNYAKEKR